MKRRTSIPLTILGLLIGPGLWNVGNGMKTNAAQAKLATTKNTFTVINTNDSGKGSLRDAIARAASGDTIKFRLAFKEAYKSYQKAYREAAK